jgi:hypothetical protein
VTRGTIQKREDPSRDRPDLVGTQSRGRLPSLFVKSLWWGVFQRHLFDQVERYCMFLGYPRSGHSLVGSLLDAHPDVVLAHELDSVRLIRLGFRRDQLFALILANERSFTDSGRLWTGSDYRVPDQWQGAFRRLRVIGDKKGGQSTRRLREAPERLDGLRRTVGVPLRVVHVIRNPFDNIASMSLRRDALIDDVAEDYFGLCAAVEKLVARFAPEEIAAVRYETLVEDPLLVLSDLCRFLGVETESAYLRDAASILKKGPSLTRERVTWSPRLRAEIEHRMADHEHLSGYSFDHQSSGGERTITTDGDRPQA